MPSLLSSLIASILITHQNEYARSSTLEMQASESRPGANTMLL